MTTWVIVSWVFVAILTGINIFIFRKLHGASKQMMGMIAPGAKDMNEAMAQMQNMFGAAVASRTGGRRGKHGAPFPGAGMGGTNKNMDAQLRAAMQMLQKKK